MRYNTYGQGYTDKIIMKVVEGKLTPMMLYLIELDYLS